MNLQDVSSAPQAETGICPGCQKPADLCVCASLAPVEHKLRVLILQHPQEQDKELGTAWLAHRMLPHSYLKVGLSWPNLQRALGEEADPRRWGVLYLGTVSKGGAGTSAPMAVVDRHGEPLEDQENLLKGLEGVILLDGTWEQAKTLWWRNPWLMKARRIVLNPDKPSLYGSLRREPRRASLSTLEAAAFTLSILEKRPELYDALTRPMQVLLEAWREKRSGNSPSRPPSKKRRPWRRKN